MKKSELRSIIREILSESTAVGVTGSRYWVALAHAGVQPHKKYLMRNGKFGRQVQAHTFHFPHQALAASKKTGLNTHVIDQSGRVIEATK